MCIQLVIKALKQGGINVVIRKLSWFEYNTISEAGLVTLAMENGLYRIGRNIYDLL